MSIKIKTPKGMRLHIGIFGRRNVGKSTILNAMLNQNISIVSDFAGTTTDPVEKAMELNPAGPVLFIDTAGIDDQGALGKKRIDKTKKVLKRVEIGLIVTDTGRFDEFEWELYKILKNFGAKVLAIFNKSDIVKIQKTTAEKFKKYAITAIEVSALKNSGITDLKKILPLFLLKTLHKLFLLLVILWVQAKQLFLLFQ